MRGLAHDPEALIERARQLGCEDAEVYLTGGRTTPVTFAQNRLQSIETAEAAAAAVRVVKDGRLGLATTTRPGDLEVVDMAARAADLGPAADFRFAGPSRIRTDLKLYDPAAAAWPPEEMAAVGERLVEAGRRLADGAMVAVNLERQTSFSRVVTLAGQDAGVETTSWHAVVMVDLVEPDNMIQVWTLRASRLLDVDPDGMSREISWLFERARLNVPCPPGRHTVIFAPQAAASLAQPLVDCLDGKAVMKGESPWRDKVGQEILAREVTLRDDPTLDWGVLSTPFDDEGVPTSARTIVEAGVLRGFYLDLRTAKALGRGSTGNARRRNPQSPPAPGPSNFVLEPGATPPAQLIAGLREGLYVASLIGAWAGNPYSGDLTGNVLLGFRIEKGEITGRVKDCLVSLNVHQAFRHNLVALGADLETTWGGHRLPHVVLDGVTVSGKTG